MSQSLVAGALPSPLVIDTLRNIESAVDSAVAPIAHWANAIVFFPITIGGVSFPFVVAWLILAGVVLTIYLGFIQVRGLRTAFDVVRGKFSRDDDPGQIPHFHALTSALSGTVGLGNIAGVGAAMALGGAGATFWMIIAGLLGMATKFAECTLGVKYRTEHKDGSISGGPFAYLPIAFAKFGRLPSTVLTGIYAVAILMFGLAGGNMFQANQTFAQARSVAGGSDGLLGSPIAALIFGVVLAGLTAAVIIGGIRSIGRVTSRLVPAMALIYVLGCLVVIGLHLGQVPEALAAIFYGAFAPEGIAGGILGVMIVGIQRAAFSNEAGLGSAAIAHSAVKTRRPVSEGFVALFEPFIDTVVICTMTALTIIIVDAPSFAAGQAQVAAGEGTPDGVLLTSDAFGSVLPWFPIILSVAVALFAFSTMVTWSYYAQRAWFHLFGASKVSDLVFKVIYCSFTVLGALLTFSEVLSLTDAALFVCAFINLLGVYLLMPKVRAEVRQYLADRKSGQLLRDRETVPSS